MKHEILDAYLLRNVPTNSIASFCEHCAKWRAAGGSSMKLAAVLVVETSEFVGRTNLSVASIRFI